MDLIRNYLLLLIVSLPMLVSAQEKAEGKLIKELDSTLSQMVDDWDTPGMAVAIVKNDSIWLSKGYGVKNIKTGERVNENSIFPIASITKSFTSASIARLVDRGKLHWDDKVQQHLPWFKLYSPYVTENMTIRDLLCHRSGLKTFSGDLLWNASTYSREEIVRKARHLEPEYGFRAHFGYSNIMYIAAGEIIENISGMKYEEYIRENFLRPLGMDRTLTSVSQFDETSNVVTPHVKEDSEMVTIPFLNWDNIGGAGLLNSSVRDMTQWIQLQLNQGEFNDKRYFSEENSNEMWQSHTPQNVSKGSQQLWPSTHFKSYGLGWGLSDYHGRKIIGHSGGYDGIVSFLGLVPEENMGFILLTNSGSMLYYATRFTILDAFLSPNDETNWSKLIMNFQKRREKQEKQKTQELLKQKDPSLKPTRELIEYTGTYGGKMYGDAEVTLKNDKLHVQLLPSPKYHSTLKHLRYNTFIIEMKEFPSLPKGSCHFVLDKNGNPAEMKIHIPNPDFFFEELKFLKQ